MLQTMRARGAGIVDIKKEPEIAYAGHCREADIRTAAFRNCLSYYNGEGDAKPGSLADVVIVRIMDRIAFNALPFDRQTLI